MPLEKAVLCINCDWVFDMECFLRCPKCFGISVLSLARVLNRQGQQLADARTEMAGEMAKTAPEFYTPLWQLDKEGGKA
jgi:hypothetical protein